MDRQITCVWQVVGIYFMSELLLKKQQEKKQKKKEGIFARFIVLFLLARCLNEDQTHLCDTFRSWAVH